MVDDLILIVLARCVFIRADSRRLQALTTMTYRIVSLSLAYAVTSLFSFSRWRVYCVTLLGLIVFFQRTDGRGEEDSLTLRTRSRRGKNKKSEVEVKWKLGEGKGAGPNLGWLKSGYRLLQTYVGVSGEC